MKKYNVTVRYTETVARETEVWVEASNEGTAEMIAEALVVRELEDDLAEPPVATVTEVLDGDHEIDVSEDDWEDATLSGYEAEYDGTDSDEI